MVYNKGKLHDLALTSNNDYGIIMFVAKLISIQNGRCSDRMCV